MNFYGNTNIIEGIKKGFKVINDRYYKNNIVSVFLLSDGENSYPTHVTE